jgi:hypothetical protein
MLGRVCSTKGEKRDAYRLLVGLERWDEVGWTGLVWLRIGTSGELL